MKKIGVISAILEEPELCQKAFNDLVSKHSHLIQGRMGIPFHNEKISVISLVVIGDLSEINGLTGKLGNVPHVTVKTSISKKELE